MFIETEEGNLVNTDHIISIRSERSDTGFLDKKLCRAIAELSDGNTIELFSVTDLDTFDKYWEELDEFLIIQLSFHARG